MAQPTAPFDVCSRAVMGAHSSGLKIMRLRVFPSGAGCTCEKVERQAPGVRLSAAAGNSVPRQGLA